MHTIERLLLICFKSPTDLELQGPRLQDGMDSWTGAGANFQIIVSSSNVDPEQELTDAGAFHRIRQKRNSAIGRFQLFACRTERM